MNAVDTNVLFYAHDPRDPAKQAIAARLIQSLSEGVLLWQVACEYMAASRKLAPLGYRQQDACANLRELQGVWTTELPNWQALDRANELTVLHSLSFWDALLVAASAQAGVETLYSEDLGGRPPILGVRLVDPFTSLV